MRGGAAVYGSQRGLDSLDTLSDGSFGDLDRSTVWASEDGFDPFLSFHGAPHGAPFVQCSTVGKEVAVGAAAVVLLSSMSKKIDLRQLKPGDPFPFELRAALSKTPPKAAKVSVCPRCQQPGYRVSFAFAHVVIVRGTAEPIVEESCLVGPGSN